MKRLHYLLVLIFLPIILLAQPRWEVGVFAGGANYLGELTEEQYPELKETQPFLGLTGSYFLNHHLSLKGSLIFARLSGDDLHAEDERRRLERMINFKSEVMESSLVLSWEPFAHRRYPDSVWFKRILSPYLFAGAALVSVRADPDFSATPRDGLIDRIQLDRLEEYPKRHFAMPVGIGLKADMSKQAILGLEFGVRRAATDFLDGVSFTGDPTTNDWYMFGGITYSLRIGQWDSDGDGIVDKEDRCPKLAGAASAKGCPDMDEDGVEDLEDVCPEIAGPFELAGCPDTDGDLVIDKIDECPEEAGPESTNGCPDQDEDGVADQVDHCPDEVGLLALNGCPDRDEDGIADREDECPDDTGLEEYAGCPFPDEDKDGIADEDDDCPSLRGVAGTNGCPDQDSDGIADKDDKCPDSAGTKEGAGCPELSEEAKEVFVFATKNVKFATAKADLRAASKATLDRIVEIMETYPHYDLRIEGHADSRGSATTNQALSERRAKACYDYLLEMGVEAERITHKGFGESQPIGDNDTAAGREKNRRVDFVPILE